MTVTYKGPSFFERLCLANELRLYDRITEIQLVGAKYDNDVIDELWQLREVKRMYLTDTKITSAGVDELRRRMPRCEIKVNCSPPIGNGIN